MKIPSKRDWEEAWKDVDGEWSFRSFFGKTSEEAIALFEASAISSFEDLIYMPERPFKYYLSSYIDYLLSEKSKGCSDGASCFLSLIKLRLKDHPNWLAPLWHDIEPLLGKLATSQEFYQADPSIYGSFAQKVDSLLVAH